MNIRDARRQLGLSLGEFAALHQQSTHSVRRWEMPEDASGHRKPNGSAIALTEVLLMLGHDRVRGNDNAAVAVKDALYDAMSG